MGESYFFKELCIWSCKRERVISGLCIDEDEVTITIRILNRLRLVHIPRKAFLNTKVKQTIKIKNRPLWKSVEKEIFD